MKLTALFLTILLATALCESSFLEKIVDLITPEPPKGKQEVSTFFEGFFGRFNLSRPDQIIDCFDDLHADVFYRMLYEVNEILKDTSSRKSLEAHFEFGKLAILKRTLRSTKVCMALTQDFADLLKALDIKDRDHKKWKMIKYVYFQASYPQLVEDFQPVIGHLDNDEHGEAGDKLGSILENLVNDVRDEGLAYLANQGFANGAAVALDVPDPSDSVQCNNNDTAHLNLKFHYEFAKAISEGSITEVIPNMFDFWYNTGKDIMKQIPDDVIKCISNSTDAANINEKLGINPMSSEFRELAFRYISNHRVYFYGHMKTMKDALENHNFAHAGNLHGRFVNAIACSK